MTEEVEDRLIARFEELNDRYDRLNAELVEPAIASNPAKSITIAKELGRLRRFVDPFKAFRKVRSELEGAHTILADRSQDPELRQLAEVEIDTLEARHDEMLETLKSAIVSGDDAAINSVILEIRPGTGGEEAALFVRNLFEMYQRFCEKKGLKVEVLGQSGSDMGGLNEVVMNV